jgi:hypothetical protein
MIKKKSLPNLSKSKELVSPEMQKRLINVRKSVKEDNFTAKLHDTMHRSSVLKIEWKVDTMVVLDSKS